MNTTKEPSVALPVIALVAVVVFWPLGLLLSIIAIVKYGGAKGTSAKTLSIVAVAANALMLPMCGILAAIAIPNFVKFQCRAKQSEAKTSLKAIYVLEEAERGAGGYTTSLETLGFTPMGTKIRYQYVIERADDNGFTARATATDPDLNGDEWTIDQDNRLENVVNGCQR